MNFSRKDLLQQFLQNILNKYKQQNNQGIYKTQPSSLFDMDNKIAINLPFEQIKFHKKFFCEFEETHTIILPPIDYNDNEKDYKDRWFQVSKFTTWFQRGLAFSDYLLNSANNRVGTENYINEESKILEDVLDHHKVLYIKVKGIRGMYDEDNRQTDIVGVAKFNSNTGTYDMISSVPFQIHTDNQIVIYLEFLKYRPVVELSQGGNNATTNNNVEKYTEFYSFEEKQHRLDTIAKTNLIANPNAKFENNLQWPIYRTYLILEMFYAAM